MYREQNYNQKSRLWNVFFLGNIIKLPLRKNGYWLDWDIVCSILGHDSDVKSTYEYILMSKLKPDIFIDIGSSYGTHSLLFLSQGVSAISFEPNKQCHGYFNFVCALNSFEQDVRSVALGAAEGTCELSFPERQTWLGTIKPDAVRAMEDEDITVEEVKQARLDNELRGIQASHPLIKIDAEGSELEILEGGRCFIRRSRPLMIIESWYTADRQAAFELLNDVGYGLIGLPIEDPAQLAHKTLEQFLAYKGTNFLAVPTELKLPQCLTQEN